MNISIANILPSPPPAPAPPASSGESSDSTQSSGFSQQLSHAKSRTPQAADSRPGPQSNATTNAEDAQKAQAGSAQDKNKSKGQSKQQDSKDSEGNGQVQGGSEEEAEIAEETQNPPVPVQAKVLLAQSIGVLPVIKQGSGAGSKSSGKSNASGSKSAGSGGSTNSTLAAGQQASTAKNATASGDDSDSDVDSTTLKASTTKPNVSPFKAQDEAAEEGSETAAAAGDSVEGSIALPAGAKDKGGADTASATAFADLLPTMTAATPDHVAAPMAAPVAPQTPVAQFAESNQPAIVSTIHGSLMPDGGSMNITLNPPELGAMQISVKMANGVMSASFETSSEQATRLLTHNLSQLKTALEAQGVTVDRLHVQQTAKSDPSSGQGGDSDKNDSSSNGKNGQQEQERRETLKRLWRRARGERDPLDLVA